MTSIGMDRLSTGFLKCEWCGRITGGALLCDVCERWEPWKLSVKRRAPYELERLMRKDARKGT